MSQSPRSREMRVACSRVFNSLFACRVYTIVNQIWGTYNKFQATFPKWLPKQWRKVPIRRAFSIIFALLWHKSGYLNQEWGDRIFHSQTFQFFRGFSSIYGIFRTESGALIYHEAKEIKGKCPDARFALENGVFCKWYLRKFESARDIKRLF